jgi:hypothetical protein
MKTTLNRVEDMKAGNPYPEGRWTSPSVEVSLKSLFWSLPESRLARESVQKIDLLLEAVSAAPPLLTAMDCPMPETA